VTPLKTGVLSVIPIAFCTEKNPSPLIAI